VARAPIPAKTRRREAPTASRCFCKPAYGKPGLRPNLPFADKPLVWGQPTFWLPGPGSGGGGRPSFADRIAGIGPSFGLRSFGGNPALGRPSYGDKATLSDRPSLRERPSFPGGRPSSGGQAIVEAGPPPLSAPARRRRPPLHNLLERAGTERVLEPSRESDRFGVNRPRGHGPGAAIQPWPPWKPSGRTTHLVATPELRFRAALPACCCAGRRGGSG